MTTNDATADAGLDLSTTSARAAGDCRSAGPCLVEYPAHDANWQGRRRPTARAPTKEPADPGTDERDEASIHIRKGGESTPSSHCTHHRVVERPQRKSHTPGATHRTTRRPYDGIRFVGREVTSLRADDQGGRANPPTIVELPWAPRAQEGRQQLTRHRVANFAAAQTSRKWFRQAWI